MASNSTHATPFWLVNVDPALNPPECPAFLQNLAAKDISIIGTPDYTFHPLSWSKVQKLISTTPLPPSSLLSSFVLRHISRVNKVQS